MLGHHHFGSTSAEEIEPCSHGIDIYITVLLLLYNMYDITVIIQ